MIAGKIGQFKLKTLPPIMVKAFGLLQEIDFREKEVGQYSVDDDKLLYHVQEYATLGRRDVYAESHRLYCDVQFVVSGKEAIGWAPYHESQQIATPYNEENDVTMIHPPKNETMILMEPGTFAFFAPEDVHRPRLDLIPGEKEKVKKVVIKIKVDGIE